MTRQADFALRRADQVIISTTEDAEYLTARLGVPPERVSLVNGGVLPVLLGPVSARVNRPPRAILFVGTWIERKGIRDLVEALTAVLPEYPDARATVAGCGTPTEVVIADFPPAVRGRVTVVPRVGSEAGLRDIYAAHSLFVAPSVFEGQMLVMLEAAAAGLAILTTGVCGMKDFITEGANGLTVPPGDSDALADKLRWLLDDPALGRRLGDAAREKVQAYTWQRSAGQYLAAAEAAFGRREAVGRGVSR